MYPERGTASGNVASMREPLDGSLWWYWIAANAEKKQQLVEEKDADDIRKVLFK